MKCINCGHEHTDHDYLLEGPQFQQCRLCKCQRNIISGVWGNDSGFLEMGDLSNLGDMEDEL